MTQELLIEQSDRDGAADYWKGLVNEPELQAMREGKRDDHWKIKQLARERTLSTTTGDSERQAAAPVSQTARPAWWRCTSTEDRRFTVGVAYEVQEYDRAGRAVIMTDDDRARATLPVKNASFVPHDPWASQREQTIRSECDTRQTAAVEDMRVRTLERIRSQEMANIVNAACDNSDADLAWVLDLVADELDTPGETK